MLMLTLPSRCSGCIAQLRRVLPKPAVPGSGPSGVFRVSVGAYSSASSNSHDARSTGSQTANSAKFVVAEAAQQAKLKLSINDAIAKPGSAQEPICSLPNKAAFEPHAQRSKLGDLMRTYAAFSKFRLSALVVATGAGAYMVAPGSFDPVTFGACCLGTMLLSSSANTWNQLIEVRADSQMKRTSSRPLVTGRASRTHACAFATGTALGGAALLATLTNELTLALGVANLLLYVCAYTPMKRIHYCSMYVGSLVGAIPPLMGWAAATGGLLSPAALIVPAILFSWQFPHFNALSWNQRDDYARAGYRIMATEKPMMARRTALTHSLALAAVCTVAPLTGLTTPVFALATAPVNAYLVALAVRFNRDGDSQSSRRLFRYSLLYLPIVLVAMLAARSMNNSDPAVADSKSESEPTLP